MIATAASRIARHPLQRMVRSHATVAGVGAPEKSIYAVMVALKVKPGMEEKFIEAALDDAGCSVRDEPGCRRFDVVQDNKDKTKFAFCEIYDDEAAFTAHKDTPHFARWKESSPNLLAEKEKVTFCKNVFPASKGANWDSDRGAADHKYFKSGSLALIHAPHYVKKDCVDGFIEAICEDARDSISEEPGCLRFDVLQAVDDPQCLYLYEVYSNHDAFEYHCGTPHIDKWKAAVKDMYDDSHPNAIDGKIAAYQDEIIRIGRNVFPPDNWEYKP
uniref:ABM domain-containing protein n=1 Tax=Lotharella globosa TaxID=91324 RepID=A0A7S3ZCB7_9EUKA